MNTAIRSLAWELVWKNRIVFPALLLILVLGAALAFLLTYAAPEIWWSGLARGAALIAFMASLLLGFAAFSLMESYEGWRMNSMTTRWFVLPLRTAALVVVPLVMAWALIAMLMVAWSPILERTVPGLDHTHILLVWLVGVAGTQALAWAVPRKPGQYWSLAAMVFVAALIFSLAPAGMPQWGRWRAQTIAGLALAIPALVGLGWWAARRNRCGDWPGEIPRILSPSRRRGTPSRDFRGTAGALFWTDGQPLLRTFLWSWLALATVVIGYISWVMKLKQPDAPIDSGFILRVASELLPPLGILWLAGFGLFLGCEPGAGFRTGLSSFRATLPVHASSLMTLRLATLVLAWGLVWAPLLVLHFSCTGDFRGIPRAMADQTVLKESARMAYRMAVSAHLVVGALPLFLLGRWAGFPPVLLAAMSSWAYTYLLVSFLDVEDDPGRRWIMLGLLLALKLGVAGWALRRSCRAGETTRRFAVSLVGGWFAVTIGLIWALPSWPVGGAWRAASLVLLVPLARLASCPWAVASNRHR